MERVKKVEYLIDYFDPEEIIYLINTNPDINDIESSDVEKFIEILKNYEIDENSICEIIYANPFCLNRLVEDIQHLIKKLQELKIDDIATVFESNPWFLDKDPFEIDEYIQEKIENGNTIESVLDELSMGII